MCRGQPSCQPLCCCAAGRAAAGAAGGEPEGSVHGERANFGGLVLGCIDSYDSESRRIFSDFSRSTIFSPLRTALNPKFQQKTCQNFTEFSLNFAKFRSNFAKFQRNFSEISTKFQRNFSEISSEFHQNSGNSCGVSRLFPRPPAVPPEDARAQHALSFS